MSRIKELYNRYKEAVNYLIVGGLTTVVSLVSYFVMTNTFLDPTNPGQLQAANVLSWIFAVAFAFFTNRKFVFESHGNKLIEAAKFVASRLTTLGLEMFLMFLFVTCMTMPNTPAKLIAQALVMLSNYVISKFFVFRKTDKLRKEIDERYKDADNASRLVSNDDSDYDDIDETT